MTDEASRRDDEIAAMLSRPPDDPERVAWERRPENRAVAEAYGAFMNAETHPEIRADAAALANALAGGSTARRPRRSRSGLPRYTAIAASVLLMIGGAFLLTEGLRPPSTRLTGIERGAEDATVRPPRPTSLGKDTVRLEWDAVATADAYEVRVLDADLRIVDRISTSTASVDVDLTGRERPVWFVVEARRDGDAVGMSAPVGWPR